jgi:hypothetical protein
MNAFAQTELSLTFRLIETRFLSTFVQRPSTNALQRIQTTLKDKMVANKTRSAVLSTPRLSRRARVVLPVRQPPLLLAWPLLPPPLPGQDPRLQVPLPLPPMPPLPSRTRLLPPLSQPSFWPLSGSFFSSIPNEHFIQHTALDESSNIQATLLIGCGIFERWLDKGRAEVMSIAIHR